MAISTFLEGGTLHELPSRFAVGEFWVGYGTLALTIVSACFVCTAFAIGTFHVVAHSASKMDLALLCFAIALSVLLPLAFRVYWWLRMQVVGDVFLRMYRVAIRTIGLCVFLGKCVDCLRNTRSDVAVDDDFSTKCRRLMPMPWYDVRAYEKLDMSFRDGFFPVTLHILVVQKNVIII